MPMKVNENNKKLAENRSKTVGFPDKTAPRCEMAEKWRFSAGWIDDGSKGQQPLRQWQPGVS
jgi:hypothetical protein